MDETRETGLDVTVDVTAVPTGKRGWQKRCKHSASIALSAEREATAPAPAPATATATATATAAVLCLAPQQLQHRQLECGDSALAGPATATARVRLECFGSPCYRTRIERFHTYRTMIERWVTAHSCGTERAVA